ncbi:MAG: nucleoside recognition domain-containing protein [Bacillota bacterium]|nr:nucleoside recognition domain-containing protein [Bacillota bacterium]
MDWALWFTDTGLGCLKFLLKLAAIIFPLMIGIELLKQYKLLEKLTHPLEPLMRLIGLPADAAYPMFAGLVFGFFYGGGLIIDFAKQGILTHKQMVLTCVFLAICHSVLEDHALIIAIGGQGLMLLAVRFVIAVLVTMALSRILKDKPPLSAATPIIEKSSN